MRFRFNFAASAIALACIPAAALAQEHQHMPGMTMPPPTEAKQPPAQMPMDHAHMDHMAMPGALGPYPMSRESSGTAWQPDTSEHSGLMSMSGDWTLMAHGTVNLVYDRQSGPRGDDKAFASGMLMGMARRPLGDGTLQLKAMVSPDPLMSTSGYPLLLASGETANGKDRLIDRQHPHDFVMELSASVSQTIGDSGSVFLYAGLPGEPAFGPPAFMHREAIMDSPEAPISHHWLDSTHISFGVLTGGIVLGDARLEASRFNGREPDQHRWDIETGALDSTAVRLSWNPSPELSLQGSWAHLEDPEQLEPGVDQKRWSASALYARDVAPGWKLAATMAWGRKTVEHHKDDAFVAELGLEHGRWTLFGRGEMTENRELVDLAVHGPAYRVGKVGLGAVRDFAIAEHLSLGAGGLVSVNFVPEPLDGLYGGSNPVGAMAFVRLKLD
ncbi:MAG TPA: hypothetical protein VFG41_09850 [Sphingomicrobium sp.]|nr:hypothetical protein [Sphingomicrobium sp.]